MSFAPRRAPRYCARLPVLSDGLHDLSRSRAVTLSAQLQILLSITVTLALGLPTCADVVGSPLSETFALSVTGLQVAGVLLSLLGASEYNSPLWLLVAVPVVATELSFLVAKDTYFCLDPALRVGGFGGTFPVTADTAALRAFSYSAPLSVILFVRSLTALLVAIQLVALFVILVYSVIAPFRHALVQRSNAWARARYVTRPSRWGVLLPDELSRAHDDAESLWASDEAEAAADAEERFVSFLAEQEIAMGGAGGGVVAAAVASFANEDITSADFIARSVSGGSAMRRRARKARFGDARGGCVRTCVRATDYAYSTVDVIPIRLALAVLSALTALVIVTLWSIGPLVGLLDEALGWLRTAKSAVWVAADLSADPALVSLGYNLDAFLRGVGASAPDALRLGVCISAALVSANVVAALPRFVADHILLVSLRARRGVRSDDVATMLGGALGRTLMQAGAVEKAQQDQGSARFGGGGLRGLDGSETSSSLNGKDAGVNMGVRRFEADALRLAAFRLGLDLLPSQVGVAPLHRLPLAPAFEHTLAFDFVPSFVASALFSWALLSALTSLAALAVFIAPVPVAVGLVSVFGALAIRTFSYRVLEGLCFRRKLKAPARPRCARFWMATDSLAMISPLSWAQGIAGAAVRVLLTPFVSAFYISSLSTSFLPIPFLDAPFASHAALVRGAFLEGPPPGYDSVEGKKRRNHVDDGNMWATSKTTHDSGIEDALLGREEQYDYGGGGGGGRSGGGGEDQPVPEAENEEWYDASDRRDPIDTAVIPVAPPSLTRTPAVYTVPDSIASSVPGAPVAAVAASISAISNAVSSAVAASVAVAAPLPPVKTQQRSSGHPEEDRARFGLGSARAQPPQRTASVVIAPATAQASALTETSDAPVQSQEIERRDSDEILTSEREAELAKELGL